MSLLGIHLTLLIGPTIAIPAPATLIETLSGVEVTHNDQGQSGFQLTFLVGRSGPIDLVDYQEFLNPVLLKAFNRVVILIRFAVAPQVLMDGVITNVQLVPSNDPGNSTIVVTGEDLTVLMSLNNFQPLPWPSLTEDNIVRLIVAKYGQYGIIPDARPPVVPYVDPPTEHVPVQDKTDLDYVRCLATRQGYVFYIDPGPLPNLSKAYWGPPNRIGIPQKALSVNMGPFSNVDSISFTNNALAPTTVMGSVQDSLTNQAMPVIASPVSTRPPLAAMPAHIFNQPNVRRSRVPITTQDVVRNTTGGQVDCDDGRIAVGTTVAEAMAVAQATVDASADNVVTGTGVLDALQYGDILLARGKVGVRGVGYSYSGDYYVKSVSHSIKKGEYKQRFTLAREGLGSLTPLVRT
ncbi:MAG TPA: hypothetical protein VIF81_07805 [Pyrinomonadaceae bacterium]|jgi:hypothetical protein